MISDLDPVEYAYICDKPLLVFENDVPPGEFGIVIQDWCCDLSFWIGQCRRIVAETPELAERILKRLEAEETFPLPELRIMEARCAA